jgi:hypothetical protein
MLRRPDTKDFKHPAATQRRTRRKAQKRTVRTLLSPEQMNQALARESARVDRKGAGALSLVLFRIPESDRSKLSAVRLAHTILKRIRVTDDVGWFDSEHLGLLLPETPPMGAWQLAQQVCDVVARRGSRPLCTMYTYPAEETRGKNKVDGIVRTDETIRPAVKVAS